MADTLVSRIEALIEDQGTDYYVSLVLEELGIEFVEDVPDEHAGYFLSRCIALMEEDL